jgi:DNA-binding NtrC family response regulator
MPDQTAASNAFRALILEDDEGSANMLAQIVAREGGESVVCPTFQSAVLSLDQTHFDLLLLDHGLPDGTGADFFHFARAQGVGATAIMLTGLPDLSTAVELTRRGLFDYLTKPFSVSEVSELIRGAVERCRDMRLATDAAEFVGQSSAMQEVKRQAQQAAENPGATVLLTGETGVGKDLTARMIHRLAFAGTKVAAPFVTLNAANLPGEMFEAELFGAERGAYTGAHQQRTGLVQAAQNGTLFLDEIAELPFPFQAKLLGFLESREYRRLGSTEVRRFSGRIIAATNRNLEAEVQAGRFRADLWYRLDVFSIPIPALRERQEDIPALAEFSLSSLARRHNRPRPQIRAEDLALLASYSFPGNIRELRNIIERSLLQTPRESGWLQLDAAWVRRQPRHNANQHSPPIARPNLNAIESQEYATIKKALLEENGAIRRAASRVGLTHQALLRRLEKWPELRIQKQDGIVA